MSAHATAPQSAAKKTRAARWALGLTLLILYTTLGVVRDIVNVLRARGVLTGLVTLAFGVCAVLVLTLALKGSRRPLLTVGILAMCTIPYIALIQLMFTPEERVHLIEYGVVALLAYASFSQRYTNALLFTLAAGWLDEAIQALLPSRRYDLRDVAFNVAAGALALASLAAVRRANR